MFLDILFIVLIVLFTRTLFGWIICKGFLGSDVLFHLALVEVVKNIGWKRSLEEVIPTYPKGFHWFLSLFPKEILPYFERVNGAFFDGIHVLLFVLLLIHFIPDINSWLIPSILLVLSPAWLAVGYGPRVYEVTERVMSELLIALVFALMWLFAESSELRWLFFAALAGSCVLLSSKFGAQVLFFFALIISVVEMNFAFLFPPLGSVALAMLFSNGSYKHIFLGQIKHLTWYWHASLKGNVPISERNSYKVLLKRWRERGWSAAISYLLLEHSILIGIIHHLILIFVLALSILFGIGELPENSFAYVWLIAGVFMWLLTSSKWFLFIGEAERYLLAIVIPEYYIIAFWLKSVAGETWFWVFVIYSIAWWLLQQLILWKIRINKNSRRIPENEEAELYNFVNSLKTGSVMTIGGTEFMWEAAYRTAKSHLHFMMDPRVNISINWRSIFRSYPYPDLRSVDLLDINYVIVNKSDLACSPLDGKYDFSGLVEIYSSDYYQVYKCVR